MEFRDTFTIPADPDRVWTAMFDPDVMRQVLPGCRRLERVAPETFDVTLGAGIGVLRGVFTGSVAWWAILTGIVAGLSTRLTPRVIRWLNIASAVIIGGFGVAAILIGVLA